jgi:hypothetical protein
VTHDLAMSLDGKILYGLDDPALAGGAKAIRCRPCKWTAARWCSWLCVVLTLSAEPDGVRWPHRALTGRPGVRAGQGPQ